MWALTRTASPRHPHGRLRWHRCFTVSLTGRQAPRTASRCPETHHSYGHTAGAGDSPPPLVFSMLITEACLVGKELGGFTTCRGNSERSQHPLGEKHLHPRTTTAPEGQALDTSHRTRPSPEDPGTPLGCPDDGLNGGKTASFWGFHWVPMPRLPWLPATLQVTQPRIVINIKHFRKLQKED